MKWEAEKSRLVKTAGRWGNERLDQATAAFCFHAVFALASFLLVAGAVAGLIWGREAGNQQLLADIQARFGPQGAEFAGVVLGQAKDVRSGGTAALIGVIGSLIAASNLVVQYRYLLRQIRGLPVEQVTFLRGIVQKLIAAGKALLVILVVLVSLTASTFATSQIPSNWANIASATSLLFVFGLILVAMKVGLRRPLDTLWIPALVTTAGFTLLRFGMGLYLSRFAGLQIYGAAGSFIAVVLWVQFTSLVFFFGMTWAQTSPTESPSNGDASEGAPDAPVVLEPSPRTTAERVPFD